MLTALVMVQQVAKAMLVASGSFISCTLYWERNLRHTRLKALGCSPIPFCCSSSVIYRRQGFALRSL